MIFKKWFTTNICVFCTIFITKNLGPNFQICTFYKMGSCYRHETKTNSLFTCQCPICISCLQKPLKYWPKNEKGRVPPADSFFTEKHLLFPEAACWISTSTVGFPLVTSRSGLRNRRGRGQNPLKDALLLRVL